MSYQEYYTEVVKAIHETEASLAEDDRMPELLLKLWIDNIHEFCKSAHQDYVLGKRNTYMMMETEYDEIFNKAGMEYTSELLNGLVDKELVEVGIDENGEIVYKTTDLGKQQLKDN